MARRPGEKRGSKPGERRGGRSAGTPNRSTQKMALAIMAGGITPLEYMLEIMRSPPPRGSNPIALVGWHTLRFEAAKAAAPYVHPKLVSKDSGEGRVNPTDAAAKIRSSLSAFDAATDTTADKGKTP